MSQQHKEQAVRHEGPSAAVFIGVLASLMAVNTLGVDIMLPALPHMAHSLHLSNANQQQWVVTSYFLSSGALQIVFGPLSDRFGRRWLTIGCLCLYGLMSICASLAPTFATLLLARVLQGVAAAGTRVLGTAMIRDRYQGSEMARVLSLCFMILLLAPILAPSIGALIMLVAPWQGIFIVLGAYTLLVAALVLIRIPETLAPDKRRALNWGALGNAAAMVVGNRKSAGYTTAVAISMGGIMGYITSAQQIYAQALGGAPELFTIFFSGIASGMVVSSFANSKIVMRLGTQRVSHVAVMIYLTLAGLHLLVDLVMGGETIPIFAGFQFVTLFMIGLIGANFSSMAMEPMGAAPGMAAAIQGMYSSLLGAFIGIVIGQSFDGTTLPVNFGNFLCAVGMVAAMAYAERGKLSLWGDKDKIEGART